MHPYAGSDSFPATVDLIDDSDPPNAANFDTAHEGALDRTIYLKNRVYQLVYSDTVDFNATAVKFTGATKNTTDPAGRAGGNVGFTVLSLGSSTFALLEGDIIQASYRLNCMLGLTAGTDTSDVVAGVSVGNGGAPFYLPGSIDAKYSIDTPWSHGFAVFNAGEQKHFTLEGSVFYLVPDPGFSVNDYRLGAAYKSHSDGWYIAGSSLNVNIFRQGL
jgi:hypothetical protein